MHAWHAPRQRNKRSRRARHAIRAGCGPHGVVGAAGWALHAKGARVCARGGVEGTLRAGGARGGAARGKGARGARGTRGGVYRARAGVVPPCGARSALAHARRRAVGARGASEAGGGPCAPLGGKLSRGAGGACGCVCEARRGPVAAARAEAARGSAVRTGCRAPGARGAGHGCVCTGRAEIASSARRAAQGAPCRVLARGAANPRARAAENARGAGRAGCNAGAARLHQARVGGAVDAEACGEATVGP